VRIRQELTMARRTGSEEAASAAQNARSARVDRASPVAHATGPALPNILRTAKSLSRMRVGGGWRCAVLFWDAQLKEVSQQITELEEGISAFRKQLQDAQWAAEMAYRIRTSMCKVKIHLFEKSQRFGFAQACADRCILPGE
jgi:hypothetical protein